MVTADSPQYEWDFSQIQMSRVPPTSAFDRLRKGFWGVPHRYDAFIREHPNLLYGVDAVVLSGGILGAGLIPFIDGFNIPIITIHHNYEPTYHKDNKTIVSLKGLYTKHIYNAEDIALRHSALNIALTDKDKEELYLNHNLDPKTEICVVPGLLNKEFVVPNLSSATDENKFVISGALHDRQTEDGVLFFMQHLYPVLKEICPNAQVVVAGRNPSAKLLNSIRGNGCKVIPNPVNVGAIIADARLYLNPARLGSGIKMRNIDALASGVPIVAHTNAAQGYAALSDSCMMPFSSAKDFGDAVTTMLNKKTLKKAVQEEFLRKYSYENLVGTLRTNLQRLRLLND